jgi:hypothetical protein
VSDEVGAKAVMHTGKLLLASLSTRRDYNGQVVATLHAAEYVHQGPF